MKTLTNSTMRNGVIVMLIMALMGWIVKPGNAAKAPGATNGPAIKFETLSHDFGTFSYGEIHEYGFKFTNNGSAPLIIEDVEQPCGCTIPTWSKEPIMPGANGVITVSYNSKDRPGAFRKTLMVKTNVEQKQPLMLLIKGNADPQKKTH